MHSCVIVLHSSHESFVSTWWRPLFLRLSLKEVCHIASSVERQCSVSLESGEQGERCNATSEPRFEQCVQPGVVGSAVRSATTSNCSECTSAGTRFGTGPGSTHLWKYDSGRQSAGGVHWTRFTRKQGTLGVGYNRPPSPLGFASPQALGTNRAIAPRRPVGKRAPVAYRCRRAQPSPPSYLPVVSVCFLTSILTLITPTLITPTCRLLAETCGRRNRIRSSWLAVPSMSTCPARGAATRHGIISKWRGLPIGSRRSSPRSTQRPRPMGQSRQSLGHGGRAATIPSEWL